MLIFKVVGKFFFFFSSRRRHTRFDCDWSSDVCSSDLEHGSQLALAQHLGVDRTVMTYLLDSLAEAGLVERRPDPADRRARRIVATARGRALLAGLDRADDREAFRTLLQRLALHAATALDSTSADPCTVGPAPAPEDC